MNVLNHLFLIQQSELKAQALTKAQQAHLTQKSYRGVQYDQAHESNSDRGSESTGAYRGVRTVLRG